MRGVTKTGYDMVKVLIGGVTGTSILESGWIVGGRGKGLWSIRIRVSMRGCGRMMSQLGRGCLRGKEGSS